MSVLKAGDSKIRRILHELEADPQLSQRTLSARLGIALGLTNLLLRRLATRGWVRIVRVRPNTVRYLLTPAGLAQKARMSRDYLHDTLKFYGEARDRVQDRFTDMLAQPSAERCRDVVFYGAGYVAEVGYVCVQQTPLRLVGVVDDERTGRNFFGLPIRPSASLRADRCDDKRFDRIVVMSLGEDAKVRAVLEGAGVPGDCVFWV